MEWLATLATLVVAAVVIGAMVLGQPPRWLSRLYPGKGDSVTRAATTTTGTHVLSSKDASVIVIEFSDFECNYCRTYAHNYYPTVLKELILTEKTDYAYRHLPLDVLHPRAIVASVAANCASEQGKFWEMHDALFRDSLSNNDIQRHSRDIGLNTDTFNACLANDKRDEVMTDLAEATRLGIAGTPTFVIGRKLQNGGVHVVQILEGMQTLENLTSAVRAAAAARLPTS
jgi:protein-disulfide isomerase